MLDRAFIFPPSTEHHHHHETVVQKVGTAESVALMKEMEEAVLKKIEASFPLQSNGFEAHAVVFTDVYTMDKIIRIHFSLVGHRLKVEYRSNCRQSVEEIANGIIKAVSDEIAFHVLQNISKQLIDAGIGDKLR